MPTAIDVFAKVRGHERAEQLRAAREADLLPYFRRLEGPAGPVVEMEGAERIMLGSDYPFPLGEQKIGSLVAQSPWLDEAQKAAILAGNAQEFFGLRQPAREGAATAI